ncbi:glycosyltransferase family 4 protein [Paenibacillus woosongensis]|uniref:Glycosyltransferase n=1 Tax=Paenibacillus woosongensis TaxID=307580 RepID=A0A7X2Z0B4_9BACL|nr:glycosyltransferase family 4 protein [Paenibacillus woosongensis]MUG45287.1 glycosyltransferase [Paenibacillus woosongensis]
MNILMVTYDFVPKPIWGMGQHVFELTEELKALGHQVKVVTVNRYGLLENNNNIIFNECLGRIESNIVSNRCTSLPSDESCLDHLSETVSQRLSRINFIPEVIHCHGWMMIETALKLSDTYSVPVVSTIHFMEKQYENAGGHPHPNDMSIILQREQIMVSRSDALICVSDYGQKLLEEVYGTNYKHSFIVPHGIVTEGVTDVYPINRKEKPGTKKNMVFVGRLEKEKGIQQLCECISTDLIKNEVDFEVIGTGSLETELRQKYDKKIQFSGYIDRQQVYQKLAATDYIVIPSLDEQFGIVALEAMVVGAVPIASNIGGLKQIIVDKENGFLFDLKLDSHNRYYIDGSELSMVLKRAVATPVNQLNDIRITNLRKVNEDYSVRAMALKTLHVYRYAITNFGGNINENKF